MPLGDGVIFGIARRSGGGQGRVRAKVLAQRPLDGRGTLVMQADGVRRYQYNPRFQEIMREIPKGTIYDRNGLPLATSNWDELEKHRAEYQALGIDIDRACPRTDARHYPFGGLMFDLLGDLRTRDALGRHQHSFVERDSARRLRGYRRPAHAGGSEESDHRQDGSRPALRLPRTGAAAAPSPRIRNIPRCGACSTARATSACRSTRACR